MTDQQRQQKTEACEVEETRAGHRVTSPSGNTYEVRSHTKLDELGSMYFTRSCSCPARGTCVHMAAVDLYQRQQAAAAGDYDGLNVLDRFEI